MSGCNLTSSYEIRLWELRSWTAYPSKKDQHLWRRPFVWISELWTLGSEVTTTPNIPPWLQAPWAWNIMGSIRNVPNRFCKLCTTFPGPEHLRTMLWVQFISGILCGSVTNCSDLPLSQIWLQDSCPMVHSCFSGQLYLGREPLKASGVSVFGNGELSSQHTFCIIVHTVTLHVHKETISPIRCRNLLSWLRYLTQART